jgi:glycosyltransferase involved in cell wall biosynthesis
MGPQLPTDPQNGGPVAGSVSVVVPVYNGASTLAELVAQVSDVLEGLGRSYEIVLVNDGSEDDSWVKIQELASANDAVSGIELMRNYGQHNATLAGIRAARNEVVVTMDDDLQNPPDQIPKLLDALAEGSEVVYGSPRRYRQGLLRAFASRLVRLALRFVMPTGIAAHATAFRAFPASLTEAFAHYDAPFVNVDVLLTWGTDRFGYVEVRHDARQEGRSNYTFGRLVGVAFNIVTGFTTRPLQLASFLGFAFTLVGIGLLCFVVASRLIRGAAIPGFTFLAASLSIFSGIQLFALGTIGEYLARIYLRIIDQPSYVVRGRADGTREA